MYCLGSLNNPSGKSNGITYEDYLNGYGLIGFNLTRAQLPGNDHCVSDPPRIGDLQVQMEFSIPLMDTISFIFIMVSEFIWHCVRALSNLHILGI